MTESSRSTTPETASSSPKRSGWQRLLRWGLLIGGMGLVLLLALLVAVTFPNLRREVTPPEVSGAHRVAPSKNVPDRPTAPTSGTLSVSVSTSGTSPLNLDNFPHLSPTMRKMTQEWLDRCAETDRALANITDPVLHAQMAELLKDRGNMRAFLNLPLEWENLSYEEAHNHVWEWHHDSVWKKDHWEKLETVLPPMPYSLYSEKDFAWGLQSLETCPDFYKAIGRENFFWGEAMFRMSFELDVSKGNYAAAAENSRGWGHYYCPPDPNAAIVLTQEHESERKQYELWRENSIWTTEELRKMYTWDEEVYCLRQMGVEGLPLLTVGSYQRALYTRTRNLQSPTYKKLQGFGDWAAKILLKKEN